ncbi:MAG: helix-turn-helix domain-containing protein [Fimbriimonadaceae bacterium]|nr:helix-turn-helix domain-containing protein [Fimbriimonadaceae bacterium]
MAEPQVQSLARGLAILELLAERGALTATAVAAELGIHQSSASRLLADLQAAGLVRKPSYHRFALDYGALVFAGRALQGFPAIAAAAGVCNQITAATGLNATVAMLYGERLLYLTRANADHSMVLVDTSDYPLHASSLGCHLAHDRGLPAGTALLGRSLAAAGEDPATAAALLAAVSANIAAHGLLLWREVAGNALNAATTFELDGRRAGLAIFGGAAAPTAEPAVRRWLAWGAARLVDEARPAGPRGQA